MEKDFSNKDLIHVKHGKLEYIQFKILQKYSDKLKHCFTLKHGGVSTGIYSSLNLRLYGKDKIENINKNLSTICDDIQIDIREVFKGKQAHTDNILILNSNNKEKYNYSNYNIEEYDGYIVNEKNIATLTTSADCNIIIIYDPVNNVVANVHSGWKGTVKKIYMKTAKLMHEKYNCNYSHMIVCVGPSINKCCWESNDNILKNEFIKIWPYEKEYITTKEDGRYLVDFPYVIKKDLIQLGLNQENIILSNICTCCNTDSFFSYRDCTKKKLLDYATQGTITQLI